MTRSHECRSGTPLRADYFKRPSHAECAAPDCFWERTAADTTAEEMQAVRTLATHHAKTLRHKVVIHLRQEVRLIPLEEARCHEHAPGATATTLSPATTAAETTTTASGAAGPW